MSNMIISATQSVAPSPQDVIEWVNSIKNDNSGSDILVIQDIIQSRISWLYSGQGAASAAPSVVPGLGTVATIAIATAGISADIALMLRNFSYMQLAMAYLHGNPISDGDKIHDDRWSEFVIVTGLFTGIIKPVAEVGKAVAVKITINLCDRLITRSVINELNIHVGAYIFTKYGTQRGLIALGKAIPFFVGIGVGATVNYLTMVSFGAACAKYYNTKINNNTKDAEYVVVE